MTIILIFTRPFFDNFEISLYNNNNNNNNSLFVPYKIKYNSSYNRSNVGYKKYAEG